MRELGRNHTRLHDGPQRGTPIRRSARAFSATTLVFLAACLLATAPAQAAPGDLDASFGANGRLVTDFGGGESASAVAIQSDGKIVVAGGADGDVALARYNPDGSLDTTFSGDGRQTTDLGGNDGARGVAIDSAGRIVAAGLSGSDVAVVRYDADGSLDTTFSGDGRQTTDLGGNDGAWGVVAQPDGRIVVAGWSGSDVGLARYHADGSLDSTFSADGRQTTDLGGDDSAAGASIQADGKLVVAGWSDSDFALARYSPDGSLDVTFASDGTLRTDFGGADYARAVALQADGRIVAAGTTIPSALDDFGDFALARYEVDGSLDLSFGAGGIQITDVGVEDAGHAVALQADGRIVAAGRSGPDFTIARGDFAVVRHLADGSLDTGFSGDGMLTTDFNFGGEDPDDSAGGVSIQADGKIVAAGLTSPGGGPGDFALARYEGGPHADTAPTNTAPPAISGTAVEGQTLTVDAGTWSGSAPITLAHQWRRCDAAGGGCIDVATATAYTLTAADVGHTIRVREIATNLYGTGTVDSAATAVVEARAGAIEGTVRRAGTNAAIAGATVRCDGYPARTGGNGRYSIPSVAPGTYSCTASADRYAPSTHSVPVASGQTTTANFSLKRR